MICNIDIFLDSAWITAAKFSVLDSDINKGYRAPSTLSYDVQYVANYAERSDAAISSCYPVTFDLYKHPTWPAFLLDILPSGAARREMLHDLELKDGPTADWNLLNKGAGNPIGNIRVHQAVIPVSQKTHPGFNRNNIIERGEDFIEYAKNHGAPVSGSSGAQGDAPKFLLTEDGQSQWHADGALHDALAKKHWIVKFPRGKLSSDRKILKNEEAYYKVANKVGLRVGAALQFENNTLFIPRFDREIIDGTVHRYGLESLCSLAGIAEFGAHTSHDTLIEAIAKYSTNSQLDIEEYILRDVMNIALGNTDNHPRNTSILKKDKEISLSPLYDFAPMILDDQGIPRTCRWENADDFGQVNWNKVLNSLAENRNLNLNADLNVNQLTKRLLDFSITLKKLPDIMSQCGVDEDLVTQLKRRIDGATKNLSNIRKL